MSVEIQVLFFKHFDSWLQKACFVLYAFNHEIFVVSSVKYHDYEGETVNQKSIKVLLLAIFPVL